MVQDGLVFLVFTERLGRRRDLEIFVKVQRIICSNSLLALSEDLVLTPFTLMCIRLFKREDPLESVLV